MIYTVLLKLSYVTEAKIVKAHLHTSASQNKLSSLKKYPQGCSETMTKIPVSINFMHDIILPTIANILSSRCKMGNDKIHSNWVFFEKVKSTWLTGSSESWKWGSERQSMLMCGGSNFPSARHQTDGALHNLDEKRLKEISENWISGGSEIS